MLESSVMDLENIIDTVAELVDFEREMAVAYKEGRVNGPAHFSVGNEEQLIKIFRGLRKEDIIYREKNDEYPRDAMVRDKLIEVSYELNSKHPIYQGIKKDDWVFASYRSHIHALLKGATKDWLKEIITSGKSMYPISRDYKLVTSAIVPGHIPIATGTAIAVKRDNKPYHVWAFCGDMAAETGIFEECTKYAQNFDLPITYVIEDNAKSVDTPTFTVWNGQSRPKRRNTIMYSYELDVPHQGVGKEVGF